MLSLLILARIMATAAANGLHFAMTTDNLIAGGLLAMLTVALMVTSILRSLGALDGAS